MVFKKLYRKNDTGEERRKVTEKNKKGAKY